IARMFPPNDQMAYIKYVSPHDGISERWEIGSVGECVRCTTSSPGPGDDWWQTASEAGTEFYYLETVKNVTPAEYPKSPNGPDWQSNGPNGKQIPEIWIDDYQLINKTINHVGGLLKLFAQTVDYTAPELAVADAHRTLADGDATTDSNIQFIA